MNSFLSQDLVIVYQNNQEYRSVLRRIFFMNPETISDANYLDEETLDELFFDDKNIITILDNIYQTTYENPIFSELYELAAACFFSIDKKLGVTVLFAYDYLDLFFPLLVDFLKEEENLNKNNEKYIKLKQKLSRR